MALRYLILCFTSMALISTHLNADTTNQDELIVRLYQKQSRYEYGIKLLELVLSKLDEPYTIQTPDRQLVNEGRGQLMVIKGQLDLQFMSTNREREEQLIPVKVPIYRGILGLRLILTTHEKHPILKNISSVTDLRRYVGGHGTHWGDLPVYAANNLKVITNTDYETLFTLLKHNRFDYFHRGLNEIWGEAGRHSDKLRITDNVMLFYPHPVYFFVTKSRPELAWHVKTGLRLAINDGSFKKLFLEHHSDFISKGNLKSRRLIILNNPVLPPGTPELDTSWWLPEELQKQIRQHNIEN